MRQTLTINTTGGKYTVTSEAGLFYHFGSILSNLFPGKKVAVITDDTVRELYGERLAKQMEEAGVQWTLIALPPGEQSKAFGTLPRLFRSII